MAQTVATITRMSRFSWPPSWSGMAWSMMRRRSSGGARPAREAAAIIRREPRTGGGRGAGGGGEGDKQEDGRVGRPVQQDEGVVAAEGKPGGPARPGATDAAA